jgi:galactokinase
MDVKELVKEFKNEYSGFPRVFRAPGRVNLIGEHTDYNDGFVLPMAIDRYTYVVYSNRPDNYVSIYSKQYKEKLDYNLDRPKRQKNWGDYIFGVLWALREDRFQFPGANIYINSEVPVGAGLSSSAALEIATATAVFLVNNFKRNELKLILAAKKAENEFVGMGCGIMDQFVSFFGKGRNALFLDCRSLDYSYIPLNSTAVKYIVCNTMVKHELAAGEYNKRKEECNEGLKILKEDFPKIEALRDAYLSSLPVVEPKMNPTVLKRVKHVISENDRTVKAVDALKSDKYVLFGKYLNESHNSLRDLYEVSCKELDIMVEKARSIDGVLGARLTGGGFGGCTINMVKADKAENFMNQIKDLYFKETGITPDVYQFVPSDGAGEM